MIAKMFLSILILFIVAFLVPFSVISIDAFFKLSPLFSDQYVDEVVLGSSVILAAGLFFSYMFFCAFLFFYLPTVVLKFPPPKTPVVIGQKGDIAQQIRDYFDDANRSGKIFDISEKDGKIILTWSAELVHNQIIDVGSYSKKTVFIFGFDEKKRNVLITQSEKDMNWSFGVKGFNLSLSFFKGISMEYEKVWKPSFEVADGKIKFRLNKLKYNSMEILGPVKYILFNNGWSFSFGIFQTKIVQNILLAISIFLFLVSWVLFFLTYKQII